ncbi:hypothetical protein [Arabiibacter massiliensis]|uniref:hypothetical protein n=1 Tax=Arabiibacter massiliensis TaxID=1870985 RepID=UPI001E2A8897|nr:hypothetical protein [Arabiibacter massiliensis]
MGGKGVGTRGGAGWVVYKIGLRLGSLFDRMLLGRRFFFGGFLRRLLNRVALGRLRIVLRGLWLHRLLDRGELGRERVHERAAVELPGVGEYVLVGARVGRLQGLCRQLLEAERLLGLRVGGEGEVVGQLHELRAVEEQPGDVRRAGRDVRDLLEVRAPLEPVRQAGGLHRVGEHDAPDVVGHAGREPGHLVGRGEREGVARAVHDEGAVVPQLGDHRGSLVEPDGPGVLMLGNDGRDGRLGRSSRRHGLGRGRLDDHVVRVVDGRLLRRVVRCGFGSGFYRRRGFARSRFRSSKRQRHRPQHAGNQQQTKAQGRAEPQRGLAG